MQSKIFIFCDKLIESGIISIIITIPLYFNVYSHRIFEPDKIILLQSITLMMLFALTVSYLEKKRNASNSITKSLQCLFADCPFLLPAFFIVAASILSSFFSVHPHSSFWGSYPMFNKILVDLAIFGVFGPKKLMISRKNLAFFMCSTTGICNILNLHVIVVPLELF